MCKIETKEGSKERGPEEAEKRDSAALSPSSSSSPVEVPESLRDPPVLEREALGRGPRREDPLAVEDDGGAAAEQGLCCKGLEGREKETESGVSFSFLSFREEEKGEEKKTSLFPFVLPYLEREPFRVI